MIYRHTPQQIQEYFDSLRMNSSSFKVIIKEGMEAFLDQKEEVLRKEGDNFYEEKAHEIIGSAVDCYLTQGEEEYMRQYAVSKMLRKPTEKPMSIIKELFDRLVIKKEAYYVEEGSGPLGTTPNKDIPAGLRPLEFFKRDLYNIADQHLFNMHQRVPKDKPIKNPKTKQYEPDSRTWKDDNRINNMLSDAVCEEYWQELQGSIGKQLLADHETNTISAIIMSLKTHPNSAYIFQEEEGVDVIYQMPLYFEIDGEPCKILPDILIADHNEKRLSIIDAKTTSRYITRFNKEIKKWRYDIQGSFYTKGVDLARDQIGALIGKDLKDYDMNPFCFLVESATKPGVPLIFVLDYQIIIEAEYGDPTKYLDGWKSALFKYREWKEFDFSIHKKYEKTQGIVFLELDYEKENL